MKKIAVPAYKYDEKENTVSDRYICSKCSKVIKEERRVVEGKRKTKRNSIIYYILCSKCTNKK
ncbi:hypothetical protein [Clostridium tertium]|uniref:hypothetical protein n=1 Tax=Clostridium tertium TaxID=1559 RepID=UPI0024B3A876|nr:hypothetical protein [Clostridium tertium]MDI9218128.1 hypothetical protein [Clostridium tertium]